MTEEKKMKVVTVIGKENTGKTTLIKYTLDMLVKSGAFVLYYDVTGAGLDDIRAVVIWNGKVISFCSIGDEADDDEENENDELWQLSYVKQGIEIAQKNKADIIVNVCNCKIKNKYKTLLANMLGSENYTPYEIKEKDDAKEQIIQMQNAYNEILRKLN